MPFTFSVSDIIPAPPQAVYDAWLSNEGHAAITGGKPAEISAEPNAVFTVWDGYITGRNLTLEPGRRIVQSWRTTKFAESDPASQIEIVLEPVAEGTRITVNHSNVPDGHTSYRDGGWQNAYFEPMKRHFAGL
jgi:activator of HSP90 ATPase